MLTKPTHRLVKTPRMNARYLADYMAASERARRTIIRRCKYRPIARIIQHDRAKSAITKHFLGARADCVTLTQEAERLRAMLSDTDFDREVLENNADYIDSFVAAYANLKLPDAELYRDDRITDIVLNGVNINPDVRFALRRVTRTNAVKTGLATFRYAKGKDLDDDVAAWQSSFLFGYRQTLDESDQATPEQKLCVTIDAHAGIVHAAPGDALSRFRNMEAACQSIAERWASVPPPDGAVIE